MASELFDNYEEGTFTPTFAGSSSNPTVSYSTQVGTYILVGKMVQITVSVIASGTPSGGGGNLHITGLPTAKSGVQQAGTVAFTNNMNFGGGSEGTSSSNIEGGDALLHINRT